MTVSSCSTVAVIFFCCDTALHFALYALQTDKEYKLLWMPNVMSHINKVIVSINYGCLLGCFGHYRT